MIDETAETPQDPPEAPESGPAARQDPEDPVEQEASTSVDETDPEDLGDPRELRAEAKKRRLQLRAAEQERDELRARVDDHDRADVERLVADQMVDPSDLWLAVDLDSLRGDDGIDEVKVREAVAGVFKSRPHWKVPVPDFHAGARSAPPSDPLDSFGRALKGNR